MPVDLSLVIPVLDPRVEIAQVVSGASAAARAVAASSEVVVAVSEARLPAFAQGSVRVVNAPDPGYGAALRAGLAAARGAYVLTMDPDLSNPGVVIEELWKARQQAEVIIASRYVPSGSAEMPLLRRMLSRALNVVFSRGLSLGVRDMSSATRLYDARVLKALEPSARGLDVLQEILVKAYAAGWRVREVPFAYRAVAPRHDIARVVRFGIDYVRTFGRLWTLRNSIASADYDHRAHDSIIPLQRYWQRRRFRHVTALVAGCGCVLDVGCGSSRILGALPAGSVGLDILARKLRYARRFGRPLVRASALALPFPDGAFPCVVCSQVIEHIPAGPAGGGGPVPGPADDRPAGPPPVLEELDRVLAPGGRLVLGTPDYSRWEWRLTEALYKRAAPNAYADEHVTHYTRAGLIERFTRRGYVLEETRYILRGELILAFRKGIGPGTR